MYPDPDGDEYLFDQHGLFDGIVDEPDMFNMDSSTWFNMVPEFPDRMGRDHDPYAGQENVSWIMKEKEK